MNINGYQAETLFYNTMKSLGCDVKKSSKREDMYDHIDYFVDNVSYDVKTLKGLVRNSKRDQGIIWLEFTNNYGGKGWMKAPKLDKIAFLREQGFYIVDRAKLFELAQTLVPNIPPVNYIKYATPYRRANRKDIIAYVYFKDIAHLVEKIIKIK